MEGGRVSHSWCMCEVVMAMVGWMGFLGRVESELVGLPGKA